MKAFSDTKLDFIDTLLSAYKKAGNFEIVSYDDDETDQIY